MKSIYWLLFLALILRLVPLNQSLWLDEAINIVNARDRTPFDLVVNYSNGDFHPPLYHIILHYWIRLFGDSEISTRFPSVLFGLITIYYTYKLSQITWPKKQIKLKTFKLKFQIIPPILLATSGLHIYYSGEARMYSLAAMGITIAFYYLFSLSKNFQNSPQALSSVLKFTQSLKNIQALLFIFGLSIALYADYVPWLLLPLFFFVQPILTLTAFFTTAPWWPLFYYQLQNGLSTAAQYPGWGQVVGGVSIKNILLIPVKFLIGRVSVDNNTLFLLILLVPFSVAASLFFKTLLKAKKSLIKLTLAWLISPITIGTLLAFKISLLSYFRFIFLLPAFYIILVQGLSYIPKKHIKTFLSILIITNIISSLSYLFIPKFHREDWKSFSQWIDHNNIPNALTIFPSLGQAEPYNYYQTQIPATDQIQIETLPDTIYLVRYVQEIFDPSDQHRLTLEKLGYKRVSQKSFNGVVVWVYQKPNRVYASI